MKLITLILCLLTSTICAAQGNTSYTFFIRQHDIGLYRQFHNCALEDEALIAVPGMEGSSLTFADCEAVVEIAPPSFIRVNKTLRYEVITILNKGGRLPEILNDCTFHSQTYNKNYNQAVRIIDCGVYDPVAADRLFLSTFVN